ncbi:MAG: cell division protein FtsA [Bacteroidales bacterium]|nr:cell division protein FtsA [Bacteroidales bacterium]
MRKIVVGIDVGTTKIAVFIAEKKENNEIHILGMGRVDSYGVERGVVKNIEDTAKSIKTAVKEAEEMSGEIVEEVYVGIAGHHIRSKQHRGNIIIHEEEHIITKGDVDRLISEQYAILMEHGEQIIDVIPQNYIVDNDSPTINPVGRSGKCLAGDFHLITGNVTNIQNIYRSVTLAGYKVKRLVLEPIASAESVVDDDEKNAGICLVDIGGGTTDVAIFHGGIIRHTAVIPLAGNVITDDIIDCCSIIRSQAEALKKNFGACLETPTSANEIISIPGFRGRDPKEISVEQLTKVINYRVTQILEQVLYELVNTGYDKKLIAGVVLTGGGAKIKDIDKYTEFILGLDARIGTPQEHLSGTITEEMKHPMHATGIGLILKAIQDLDEKQSSCLIEENKKEENQEEQINPEESVVKKKRFGKKIEDFLRGIIGEGKE